MKKTFNTIVHSQTLWVVIILFAFLPKASKANTVAICANTNLSTLLTTNCGGSGILPVLGALSSLDDLVIGNPSTIGTSTVTLTIDANATVNSLRLGDVNVVAPSFGIHHGAIQFSNAGTYTLTVTNNVTLGNVLTGNIATGIVNMTNAGTLKLSGFSDGGTAWSAVGTYTPGNGSIELTGINTLPNHANYASFNSLTINGGITTLSRATAVTGDLTISVGVLNAANQIITMSGSGKYWTNNIGTAGFTYGTGTVIFSGNTTVDGSASTDFYNITINGTLIGRPGAPIIGIQNSFTNNGTFTHGSGTVDFKGSAGNATVGGSVTNNVFNNITVSGSNVRLGPGTTSTFTVEGNWSNTGTFNARNGTFIFSGTGAQSISGTTDPQFYDLVVAKPTGTLTQNLTTMQVSHTFSMSSGTLDNLTNTFSGLSSSETVSITGGTWRIAKTGTVVPEFNPANKYTITGGRIIFYGAGNQTVRALNTAGSAQYYELEIDGTVGTKTVEDNIYVAKSVFITSSTFSGADKIITMGGSTATGLWENNATYTTTTGTVLFNSTANQTIGGTSLTSFYNLTENKTAGTLTLNRNTTVTNVLTLTAGPLVLNAKTLNVTNSSIAAIVRDGIASTGYIISEDATLTGGKANNASYVTWAINAITGTHIIPFGNNAGVYIPFTYNLSSGNVGNLTVATYASNAANTPMPIGVSHVHDTTAAMADNSAYTVDRYWHVSTTTTGTASITFSYADNEIPTTGGETGSDGYGLRAQQWNGFNSWAYKNGAVWIPYFTNQTPSAGTNSVTVNSFPSTLGTTMPWTLALHAHPLPVKLLSFTAKLLNTKEVQIDWKTAQEINNNYFEIERSADGIAFTPIYLQKAEGNRSTVKNYSAIDKEPLGGVSYYRLKQVDFDGTYTYSSLITLVNAKIFESINVFPNPSEGDINIVFSSKQAVSAELRVYNISGTLVIRKSWPINAGDNALNLEHTVLSSGLHRFIIFSEVNETLYEGTFVKR